MASNVAAGSDATGNIKPSKKKSTERIGGIVAAVMALGLLLVQSARVESVYNPRGLLWL